MPLSFERTILVGAFAVAGAGAMLLRLNGLVHAVLPESKNMRKRTFGFSKNLRDPVVSSAISRLEFRVINSWSRRPDSSAAERKERVQPRYHQAKETKRVGMGGRKS
jgi:hypothetical protein